MKNSTLLFALFLTLTAHTAFAQKKLASGIRPYAENWTYSLVKSMHRAGFDMPTMAAAPTIAPGVSPRSELQLDSTKTFYAFNLNAPGDSTPLSRTIYKYPFPDTKIEVNYQYENGEWLQLSRETIVSDEQGRLTEVIAEVFDPATQAFRLDSDLRIFPHGDSPELIDSFFTFLWDTTILDWHIILSQRNTFDTQDRLLETLTSFDYFGDPLIFKEVYDYDDNGDNYLIEEFAILGNDIFPSSRTDLKYVDHRPIEVMFSTIDSLGFAPQSRTNYAYTLFGAVRKQMDFEWDAELENFRLVKTIEYFYDFAQRLAGKETIFIPQNAWDERERVSYAYVDDVDDKNLYIEWVHLWDHDLFDWILDSKKYFYYNGLVSAPSKPEPAKALLASPNPTTGLVQFSFDDEATVQVFDLAGQLVHSRLMQPGQALDLTALPAGVYAVTALEGRDFYSGRVVKQ